MFADRIATSECFSSWPLIVVVDDAKTAAQSERSFLWHTFTRFDPAQDIHTHATEIANHSLSYTPPIVIDSRMKPWYPEVVAPHPDTVKLVDSRWSEYF